MNSRKYKALLPTSTQLKKREEEREELIDYKWKQELQYNKKAKDLPDLEPNTEVLVQLQLQSKDWKPATIWEYMGNRSYRLRLDFNDKEYIRNKVYIKSWVSTLRQSERLIET